MSKKTVKRMTEKLPIDSKKLRARLEKMDCSITDADRKMGFKRALSNALYRCEVSLPMMKLLKSELGISYDEYKPEEPKADESIKSNAELTAEIIERTVYEATTYAIEKYMNEHLATAIEDAVRKVVG